MLSNLFTVNKLDLHKLDQSSGIEFVADMLSAESRRISIPVSDITISYDPNVPDGGIDAEVINTKAINGDLIVDKYCFYQVKTGENFTPQTDSIIKHELFGDKRAEKESLGVRVRYCLDRNGTYVLICTHKRLNGMQISKSEENLKKYFKICGYENARVMLIDQTKIILLLKRYPSLILSLKGININFQTHSTWSDSEQMRKDYIAGTNRQTNMDRVIESLRSSSGSNHIRVLGEPGIGKTKFVLETTRPADLSSLVIYCDSSKKLLNGELLDHITMEDNDFMVILVIDDCDLNDSQKIWNRLKNIGSRIKLITIYNEEEVTTGTTQYLEIGSLEEEQTTDIISTYGIPREQARKYARLCSGSPGVAHVIGINLINNPEDIFRSPDTVNIWDRYVTGSDNADSPHVQDRRRVLNFISLFKRFGFEKPYTDEAISISKLVEKSFSSITWARFQEIVKVLKRRKILQGDVTLYITPKALHVKLWNEFWETYGTGFNLLDFRNGLSSQLNDWFDEMLTYAGTSEASSETARSIIQEMLSNGPKFISSRSGSRLFLALAEGVPKLALEYLKNVFKSWSKEDLLDFREGRREIVSGLEKIVVWPDLFEDGTALLLALAEAENETWANNATGIFSDLFLPISKTMAHPDIRLKILQEILISGSKSKKSIAIRASQKALHYGNIILFNTEDLQGLKLEGIWQPSKNYEIPEYQQKVWELLCKNIDLFEEDDKKMTSKILLDQSFGLAVLPSLATSVFNCLSGMKDKAYVNQKDLVSAVLKIVKHRAERLPTELSSKWIDLNKSIIGNNFSSKLKRYVGMFIFEDVKDIENILSDLAKESIEHPELLEKEISWLNSNNVENGIRFGYNLGKLDDEFYFYPKIIEALKSNKEKLNLGFLGGYLWALYNRDPKRLNDEILKLEKTELREHIPQLCALSGLTDTTASIVLNIIKGGRNSIQFRYFLTGGVLRSISEQMLIKWVDYLLQVPENQAAWTAMDLYYSYYVVIHQQIPNKEQTLRLLSHISFFSPKFEGNRPVKAPEYAWSEIGKLYVKKYPSEGIALIDPLLEHFGNNSSIMFYNSPAISVLSDIVKSFPSESWNHIIKYLGPPTTSHSFWIESWLRGNDYFGDQGALELIPAELVWNWIDKFPSVRAPYLASFIPKTPFRSHGKICPRELLVRYGSIEEVGRALISNLDTGMISETAQQKKKRFLDLKSREENDIVKKWMDNYIGVIDRFDKFEKRMEERDFPEQDAPETL